MNTENALVYAYLLDGKGGGRAVDMLFGLAVLLIVGFKKIKWL